MYHPGGCRATNNQDKVLLFRAITVPKVLQVFHDTPVWTRENGGSGEFARDLRYLYRFCGEMARRFNRSASTMSHLVTRLEKRSLTSPETREALEEHLYTVVQA